MRPVGFILESVTYPMDSGDEKRIRSVLSCASRLARVVRSRQGRIVIYYKINMLGRCCSVRYGEGVEAVIVFPEVRGVVGITGVAFTSAGSDPTHELRDAVG